MKSTPNVYKAKENLYEYSALRSEILTIEQNRVTCRMYMYTVFFAVFSFALRYRSLFLVALTVLLVFQSFLNFDLWMMRKVSIYITLFFEKERNDIHWESMQDSPQYTDLDKSFHSLHAQFSVWISDHAAGMLALITTCFDLYFIFSEIIDIGGIFTEGVTFKDVSLTAEIIIVVLLCAVVLFVSSQTDASEHLETMNKDLESAIGEYKEKIYPDSSKK